MKKSQLVKLITESRNRSLVYEEKIMEVERNFRELNSMNMQAVLIQIEDFLDNNNMYAYKNWFEGRLWDGPNIHRHWVEFILKYDYDKMPDPRAAQRLVKSGAIIKFEEATEIVPIENISSPGELDPATLKPKEVENPIWLVHLKIPRKLIQDASVIDSPYEEELAVAEEVKNNNETETELDLTPNEAEEEEV